MGLFDFFTPDVGKLAASRDVAGLAKAAQHKRWEIRSKAVAALGAIGDVRVLPALVRSLRDDVVDIRRAAVEALGAIGSPQALRPLGALVKDEHRVASAMASEFLGAAGVIGAGPVAHVDFLEGVHRQRGVRAAAESAIARIALNLPSVTATPIAIDPYHTTDDDVVLLDRPDSLADIRRCGDVPKSGANATFYVEDHLMDGVLFFDERDQVWLSVPNWETWRGR